MRSLIRFLIDPQPEKSPGKCSVTLSSQAKSKNACNATTVHNAPLFIRNNRLIMAPIKISAP